MPLKFNFMLFNKKNRKIFAHFNAVASLPKHLALIITTTTATATTTTASQLQFVQSHHHFAGVVVVVASLCCLFFIINAVRSLFCCFLFLQRALCYWLGTFFTGFSTFSMPHTDAHTHSHIQTDTHTGKRPKVRCDPRPPPSWFQVRPTAPMARAPFAQLPPLPCHVPSPTNNVSCS